MYTIGPVRPCHFVFSIYLLFSFLSLFRRISGSEEIPGRGPPGTSRAPPGPSLGTPRGAGQGTSRGAQPAASNIDQLIAELAANSGKYCTQINRQNLKKK